MEIKSDGSPDLKGKRPYEELLIWDSNDLPFLQQAAEETGLDFSVMREEGEQFRPTNSLNDNATVEIEKGKIGISVKNMKGSRKKHAIFWKAFDRIKLQYYSE